MIIYDGEDYSRQDRVAVTVTTRVLVAPSNSVTVSTSLTVRVHSGHLDVVRRVAVLVTVTGSRVSGEVVHLFLIAAQVGHSLGTNTVVVRVATPVVVILVVVVEVEKTVLHPGFGGMTVEVTVALLVIVGVTGQGATTLQVKVVVTVAVLVATLVTCAVTVLEQLKLIVAVVVAVSVRVTVGM